LGVRIAHVHGIGVSQFDTHSCLTQSVTSAVHNEQFN